MPKLYRLSLAEKRRLISDLSNTTKLLKQISGQIKEWHQGLNYEVEYTILREGLEKLPDELVATIFEHAYHSLSSTDWKWEERVSFSFRLSHVSRRFRSISLGCADLWSYISIGNNLSMVPTILERSQNHALHVHVSSSLSTRDVMFWRESGMERAQGRIHSLYWYDKDLSAIFPLHNSDNALFPRLQHVSILRPPRLTIIDMTMFLSCPELHMLKIKGTSEVNEVASTKINFVGLYKISTLATRRCFDNLRTIQLEICEFSVLYSLFEVMAHGLLPSLTSVSLQRPYLGFGPMHINPYASLHNHNPTIRLNTLRIELNHSFLDDNIAYGQPYWKEIMTTFYFPDLRELYITSIGAESGGVIHRSLEDLEPERLDSLQTIRLGAPYFARFAIDGDYLEALCRFHNLRHLEILAASAMIIGSNTPRNLPKFATVTIRKISVKEISTLLGFGRLLRRSPHWSMFERLKFELRDGFTEWESSDEGRRCMNEFKEILDGKVEFIGL